MRHELSRIGIFPLVKELRTVISGTGEETCASRAEISGHRLTVLPWLGRRMDVSILDYSRFREDIGQSSAKPYKYLNTMPNSTRDSAT